MQGHQGVDGRGAALSAMAGTLWLVGAMPGVTAQRSLGCGTLVQVLPEARFSGPQPRRAWPGTVEQGTDHMLVRALKPGVRLCGAPAGHHTGGSLLLSRPPSPSPLTPHPTHTHTHTFSHPRLTAGPEQELRVRGLYEHPKEVRAARGLKLAAQGLENAVAGTQMLVASKDDDIEALKAEVMEDMHDIFSSVDRSGALFCGPGACRLCALVSVTAEG